MKRYLVPASVALIGFLLLGPLGLIAGLVIWAVLNKK